jgi:hypothetical protein
MPRITINARQFDEFEDLNEQEDWDVQFGITETQNRHPDPVERHYSTSQTRALERRREGKRWGRETAQARRRNKGSGKP